MVMGVGLGRRGVEAGWGEVPLLLDWKNLSLAYTSEKALSCWNNILQSFAANIIEQCCLCATKYNSAHKI